LLRITLAFLKKKKERITLILSKEKSELLSVAEDALSKFVICNKECEIATKQFLAR
jgi:hypothetical protein